MLGTPTAKYGVRITAVDQTQKTIEGVLKTGGRANILVYAVPPAFRWPQVGEGWIVRQENGAWYLDSSWPADGVQSFTAADTGDLVLTAPSGVVRIIGSDADFTLTRPTTQPTLPQLGFHGDLRTTHITAGATVITVLL